MGGAVMKALYNKLQALTDIKRSNVIPYVLPTPTFCMELEVEVIN